MHLAYQRAKLTDDSRSNNPRTQPMREAKTETGSFVQIFIHMFVHISFITFR